MTKDELLSLMSALKLYGMREAWLEQDALSDINTLPFTDRFGMLLDAQKDDVAHRRTTRLLKLAKFRYPRASMRSLLYNDRPGLNRSHVLELSTSAWVHKGDVVIITGPSGSGKSFLGCVLGHAACKKGYTVRFHRVSTLCVEIERRRIDGSAGRFIDRLSKCDVLVLDDLGRTDLKPQERRDLLDILDDRYDRKATIVTSQLAIHDWHSIIGDVSIADAILDRLVHHAHRVELTGESLRKLNPEIRRCEHLDGDTQEGTDPHPGTASDPARRSSPAMPKR